MDKLKDFLMILKKYHFWVLCGIVLVTTLVLWWMATSSLAERYQTEKAAVDSKFKALTKIEVNHPNQLVIDKIREQDKALRQDVFSAWEVLYRQQKETNPIPVALGPEFRPLRELEAWRGTGVEFAYALPEHH